jgi:hypothetical protein
VRRPSPNFVNSRLDSGGCSFFNVYRSIIATDAIAPSGLADILSGDIRRGTMHWLVKINISTDRRRGQMPSDGQDSGFVEYRQKSSQSAQRQIWSDWSRCIAHASTKMFKLDVGIFFLATLHGCPPNL